MNTMNKISPCPFCGKQATKKYIFHKLDNSDFYAKSVHIQCDACFCRTPYVMIETNGKPAKTTELDCYNLWNRRILHENKNN